MLRHLVDSGATISTELIQAVISLKEMKEVIKTLPEDFIIISITDPDVENPLPDRPHMLKIQFWDIEDTIGKYEPLTVEQGRILRNFVIKSFEEFDKPKFIVQCMAGQSRSAGVAKAIECLWHFGFGQSAKYDYMTGFSSEIDAHIRYSPNLTVFDRIIDD